MCDVANNSAPENIKGDLTRISEVLVHTYSTRPNTQGLKKCYIRRKQKILKLVGVRMFF